MVPAAILVLIACIALVLTNVVLWGKVARLGGRIKKLEAGNEFEARLRRIEEGLAEMNNAKAATTQAH